MRASFSWIMAMCLAMGWTLPGGAQVVRNRTTTVTMANSPHTARLPYTAEFKITHIQTLANGVTITHESTEVLALDSQGRRMTATTTIAPGEDPTQRTRVMVFDPVDRINSSWSVPGKKATVTHMPEPGSARTSCSTAVSSDRSTLPHPVQRMRPSVEDLGTETIQGIEAHGRRTTTITPAGVIGNNEQLVSTSEMWTAVDRGLSGLLVRMMNDDPQSGKTTREMVNFSQSEPDTSVFQPPSDYEIVNREIPVAACPGTGSTEQLQTPNPPSPPAP